VDGEVYDTLQSAEEAEAEAEEASAEGSADGTLPASLAKAERAKAEREGGSDTMTTSAGKEIKMSSQKDITVADDFETTVRCSGSCASFESQKI
jgi:hypothetical protein